MQENTMDLSELRDVQDSRGPKAEIMKYRPISADSHVMEPPNLYVDYVDPKFRERAPKMVREEGVDLYVVDGFAKKISVGALAAAGRDPREIRVNGNKFEEIDAGSWDPAARLKAQDADGVIAEMIYPSVG